MTIGAAELDRNGRHLELQVGDAVEIELKSGLLKVPAGISLRRSAPSAALDPAAAPSAAAPSALAKPGAFERGLERVDLSIAAGESIIIHDPRPPTAVGVLASERCSGSALLSIDGGRAGSEERVGEGRVGVALASGAHRYVIHCLDEAGAKGDKLGQGTISIIPDAGLRRLATSAPLTNVDADGRRYTVLYQSLQPKIAIHWPNAPPASSYILTVSSPHGTKTVTASSPHYLFAIGLAGRRVARLQLSGRWPPFAGNHRRHSLRQCSSRSEHRFARGRKLCPWFERARLGHGATGLGRDGGRRDAATRRSESILDGGQRAARPGARHSLHPAATRRSLLSEAQCTLVPHP